MSVGAHPRWRIGDVLARTRLDDLLDELTGPAERLGPSRRWHCPAPEHDDQRASVSMRADPGGHERWRCWSGDHRGDAIDLVTTIRGGTRGDAVDWLAARAGMYPDRPLRAAPIRARPSAPATSMDPAVERYVRICAAVLAGPQGRDVRSWLHDRTLDDRTIHTNLIGCDPGRQFLHRRRGLPYGKVPAATFPAFGPTGNVTFVQARYLDVVLAGRKYDNPSAAIAPHPRIAFPVMAAAPRWPWLVVCEGMPDALTAAQAGYRTVALLGAQTPDESVAARIANYAERHQLDVAVMCDANHAGRTAGTHLADLLLAERVETTLVEPPSNLTDHTGNAAVDLNSWAQLDPDWPSQLNAALHLNLINEAAIDPAQVERAAPTIALDD